MYKMVRIFLFMLPAESAHRLVFGMLGFASAIPILKRWMHKCYNKTLPADGITLWGLRFSNRVGLAAGLDKDARRVDALACMGFGFVEVGTLTPLPQSGNPLPRLFRLPADGALINRMGFNNGGGEVAAVRLKKRKNKEIIVGVNLGKNKNTPNDDAVNDYLKGYEQLYEAGDYFVVNVSSPNTPGLRDLQEKGPLMEIMQRLQQKNHAMPLPKPLLLKIAPDLSDGQLDDIVDICIQSKLDGIIATNTTLSRQQLKSPTSRIEAIGAGGLSGKPLRARSTDVIRYLSHRLPAHIPIIGVGGIFSAEDALEKIEAGATLVQVYTGFIYEGPGLIGRIVKAIRQR
ncbi:MAG: quinone-dependent dihydroorotate dehydrogenase [Candidatus Competibacteraceae bacterium]|nr:quinone-dependent dihydroorotate dehydrogenase [Candidatus Competibacteraceae bacterium]